MIEENDALHDSDDESENDNASEEDVQLGFIELDKSNKIFLDNNWTLWDGGKVGGNPIWLDLINLPSPADMTCVECNNPMAFLLQIYCPLDEPVNAFHRSLYLFCCRKADCIKSNPDSIVALRCQLPEENSFYPLDPYCPSPTENSSKTSINLCSVCGCRAPFACSHCKNVHYCSKTHQLLDWKFKHKNICKGSGVNDTIDDSSVHAPIAAAPLNWCFPEYSIIVEDEILTDQLVESKISNEKTHVWDDALTDFQADDPDLLLTQKDYSKSLGNEQVDQQYVKFTDRCRRGGEDQVLRYERWPPTRLRGPLCLTAEGEVVMKKQLQVPVCGHCGGERKFEFQVMPQLLYYLKKYSVKDDKMLNLMDHSIQDEDIDWASISVFTCTNSCSSSGTHCESEGDVEVHDDYSSISTSVSNSGGWTNNYFKEFVFIEKPVAFKLQSNEITEEK